MSEHLENNSSPLPNYIEKFIISNLNLTPPGSYGKINLTDLSNIINITKNKFSDYKNMITPSLIISLRSSFMKNYMIINHKNINNNSVKIINDYNNKINVLDISKKYDISPLNIIRFIFNKKYNNKLTYLIKHKDLLNDYDSKQLTLAINNDDFALINQDKIQKKSLDFEKEIEIFLKKNSISFQTQEELSEEQTKLYGKAVNTPDFLITSELFINKIKINWIDAKNFYGAKIYFIKKSIEKQIKKYINKYGTGCIIFKLGYNSKLNFKGVLLIDGSTLE